MKEVSLETAPECISRSNVQWKAMLFGGMQVTTQLFHFSLLWELNKEPERSEVSLPSSYLESC